MESGPVTPLVHDRYSRRWRPLDDLERAHLEPRPEAVPPEKRSSTWSAGQQIRGWWHRLSPRGPVIPGLEGIFCPEIFDPLRDHAIFHANLPHDIPRLAYFYDAIALKHPQWTPAQTVKRFPAYLQKLADFDHVACISRSSEADLQSYWKEIGISPKARTSTITLGLRGHFHPAKARNRQWEAGHEPEVLMVGTLEARKNHLALLEACELLWGQGIKFQLKLAGMLNKETGAPAAHLIETLAAAGRPVSWEGAVSNDRLLELYKNTDIFAYPSLCEGFGMPVLEALAHGLPVLTTSAGALGELVSGGGCLHCDGSADDISTGLRSLIEDVSMREKLAGEAAARPVRTMADTAKDMDALFQELGRSPSA
jgi:glycosyltransferase involved in cell wall biosynthesis